MKNTQINFSSQNLSVERNFFKQNVEKMRDLSRIFLHCLEKFIWYINFENQFCIIVQTDPEISFSFTILINTKIAFICFNSKIAVILIKIDLGFFA